MCIWSKNTFHNFKEQFVRNKVHTWKMEINCWASLAGDLTNEAPLVQLQFYVVLFHEAYWHP